jgi:hypothetical protein
MPLSLLALGDRTSSPSNYLIAETQSTLPTTGLGLGEVQVAGS